MKRLVCACCAAVLMVCLFAGCELFAEKEGLIKFRLEEEAESECVWNYFVQPEGALEKVRDEISEDENGVLYHEWLFEGLQSGDVSITFQYTEEGRDPERTVTYSCFVDENLHVGLLDTVDSADLIGTAEDELLVRSVSAIVALDIGNGLVYPRGQVEPGYAAEFLLQYVNLFCSEYAEEYEKIQSTDYEQYIEMSKDDVAELLNVAFGSRFGVGQLTVDGASIVEDGARYYFAVKDVAAIAAVPTGDAADQLQYVFTLTGGETSVDGSAQVTTEASAENPTGRSITSVTAQKNA